MFSPYMPYSGEQGLVTTDQNVVLLLVFSEPVTGLAASSFSISGPSGATVSGLKLLRGTNTYYHFTVTLPGTYYDAVTVSLQVRLWMMRCRRCVLSHPHMQWVLFVQLLAFDCGGCNWASCSIFHPSRLSKGLAHVAQQHSWADTL